MIAKRIMEELEKEGMRGRIASIDRLSEVGRCIEGLRETGSLSQSVYDLYFPRYRYTPPEGMPDARSIVIVAVPQPGIRVTFHWKGIPIPAIVPPTYAHAAEVDQRAKTILERSAGDKVCRFLKALFPYKTMAARTGLVAYGRNNITYVPKYGSFHRLTAFFTDLDLVMDQWQESEALTRCEKCRACLNNCPVGAITEDRFLIKAERCLTFLNELTADHEFPSWVSPDSHNAIVGCMHCQRVCPYNKEVIDWLEERESFSEEETEYLLKGDFGDGKGKEIEAKLGRSGLDLTVFPRNLKALLQKESRPS